MEHIKSLYNKLYDDYKSLTNEEVQVLVDDFQKRVTSKIDINNAGKYTIKSNCPNYIFSGFAIIKQRNKLLNDFRVFIDKKTNITIDDDMEVLMVNCDATLIEKIEKKYNIDVHKSNSISVSNVVEQLEKIQKLRQAGAITEEEFMALKSQVLNNNYIKQ